MIKQLSDRLDLLQKLDLGLIEGREQSKSGVGREVTVEITETVEGTVRIPVDHEFEFERQASPFFPLLFKLSDQKERYIRITTDHVYIQLLNFVSCIGRMLLEEIMSSCQQNDVKEMPKNAEHRSREIPESQNPI